MSTWSGWEAQLIRALGVQDTQQVENLLRTWATEAKTNCRNNPLAASRHAAGSSNCKLLPGGKHAQHYSTHSTGISATAAQIRSGSYPHLWAAIESGNPYDVTNPQQVADDLTKWGTPAAGEAFQIEVSHGGFGSGTGGGTATVPKAARLHKGWSDLQHSINSTFPKALIASNRNTAAGLRSIRRARKVRL